MIYIVKDTSNTIVLTLNELSSLVNPNYLFEFIYEGNDLSNPIYFTTPNTTFAPSRFDSFILNESISGSTTGGTNVSLSLMAGQYEYKVYESSASTLSISATTGVVIESGRMVVDDSNNLYINQVIPSQNNTNPNIYL